MRNAVVSMNKKRQEMIDTIQKVYGLDSPEVFSAMYKVPREEFVSKKERHLAYRDGPLPIGWGQTMSQPYTVAYMTHILINDGKKDTKDWKVLEIGTGSGYQAAVLSFLVDKVYTVEIVEELAEKARKRLKELGFGNVFVKTGSGEWGWSKKAPFDAIMVTADIREEVPSELFDQLKTGGVLVAPVKGRMKKFVKKKGKIKSQGHGMFSFVPFVKAKN
ncbi:MAG: protein-L-isoaspartate(D-aspartate) O-methyltransferase [Candidatus Woesebacteria bacterium]|jgi:protein-L-isoaspartate(D-aspartate) O-methyltransferase